jgi:hypothetical protein
MACNEDNDCDDDDDDDDQNYPQWPLKSPPPSLFHNLVHFTSSTWSIR